MRYLKLLLVTTLLLFAIKVKAASGSINVSSSTSTAVVGSTFNVTVKVSCSEALGSWQFGLAYDNAYISLQSGDTTIASYGDGNTKVKTYTYKFKAIKSGKASIRVTGASMVSWNNVDTLFTPSTSNASVTIKTQKEIEASYSKDNNLKALGIDGYEIIPPFNKDITEYNVEVPDDVKSIRVSAKVSDNTASVKGIGAIDVSEGTNRINIVVTAQNGSTKTYYLNVTVKDLNPIEVELNGEKYSVVKKAELLNCPTGYTPKTVKINDIDVPAFISEITNFVLVGLKNENGDIELFKFDENNYYQYSELKSKGLILYPEELNSNLEGYKKNKTIINDVEVTTFTSPKIGNRIIIYALNVETGYRGFYIYDKEESSFMRYDENIEKIKEKNQKDLKIIILGLATISIILLLISIIMGIRLSKFKKIISKRIPNKKG